MKTVHKDVIINILLNAITTSIKLGYKPTEISTITNRLLMIEQQLQNREEQKK